MNNAIKPFLNGKFWALFNGVREPAVVIVNDLVAVTTREFCELFEYNADELIGMDFKAITDPKDYHTDKMLYDSLMRGERDSYTLVKTYLRKRSKPFDALLIVVALRTKEDSTEKAVVSIIKPLRHRITEPIYASDDPDTMEMNAKRIIDYSHEISVKTNETAARIESIEDKRPFISRLGDWVLKLVDGIKGLNVTQSMLVAFLAALALAGFLLWQYFPQILEVLKQ